MALDVRHAPTVAWIQRDQGGSQGARRLFYPRTETFRTVCCKKKVNNIWLKGRCSFFLKIFLERNPDFSRRFRELICTSSPCKEKFPFPPPSHHTCPYLFESFFPSVQFGLRVPGMPLTPSLESEWDARNFLGREEQKDSAYLAFTPGSPGRLSRFTQ